jgi:transposase
MIHIQLDETTRNELRDLRRQGLPTKVRDRLEMVLLADAGWAPARIATYLGYCYRTVLNCLHDFQQRGRAALTPRRPGPAPDLTRRQQVTDLLRSLLAQERTWTARQLSEALTAHDLRIGPRQLRRYLRHLRAGYRRTASTLKHKQDPTQATQAAGVLLNLQQRADLGLLELYYLDECGFSPSLPTGYSWTLPGERKRVKYEYPQGRRVNALATYRPYGSLPWLDAQLFERTLTSDDLIAYLKGRLPGASVPRVVVLDNASLHVSQVTKASRPGLAKLGIYLYYLPAYSPELNEIEPVFKQVKHHEIPQRSHTSKAQLRGSVEQGFGSYGRRLRPKSAKQLRPAA